MGLQGMPTRFGTERGAVSVELPSEDCGWDTNVISLEDADCDDSARWWTIEEAKVLYANLGEAINAADDYAKANL